VFQSSHCSQASTIPFQHIQLVHSVVQVALQPSQSIVFQSSHCSQASTIPFQHIQLVHSVVQVALQPSQSIVFQSSHCSQASTIPFQHIGSGIEFVTFIFFLQEELVTFQFI